MEEEARPLTLDGAAMDVVEPRSRRRSRSIAVCVFASLCAAGGLALAARPSTTAAPRAAAALAAAPKGPAKPPAGSGAAPRAPKAPSPTAAPTTPAPSCASSDTIEAERKEHDSAEGEGQPQRRRGLLTTPSPTCLTLERVETNEAEQRTKNSTEEPHQHVVSKPRLD